MNLEKLRMMLVILCIVFSIVGIYYTIKLILLSLKPNKDKKYKWDDEEFNDDKDSSIGIIVSPDESYSDIGEAIRYVESLIDEGIVDFDQEDESLENNKDFSNTYSILFVKATKRGEDEYDLDELDLLYITTDINECLTLGSLLHSTGNMLPDIRKELNEEYGDDDWEYHEEDDLIEDNVEYKIIYKRSNTKNEDCEIYEIFSSQMKIDCELLIETVFDILKEFDEEE